MEVTFNKKKKIQGNVHLVIKITISQHLRIQSLQYALL